MTGSARVRVTLSGDHSVGPDGADAAHASIERALSGSRAEYRIRSSIPGHTFDREGNKGARESVSIVLEQSSFKVGWSALSTFGILGNALDVLSDCIRPTGEVSVRASAALGQIPATLLNAGSDPLVKRCHLSIFELVSPDIGLAIPNASKIPFKGIVIYDKKDNGDFLVFASHQSSTTGVPKAVDYMLGALSKYCEAYGR